MAFVPVVLSVGHPFRAGPSNESGLVWSCLVFPSSDWQSQHSLYTVGSVLHYFVLSRECNKAKAIGFFKAGDSLATTICCLLVSRRVLKKAAVNNKKQATTENLEFLTIVLPQIRADRSTETAPC